MRLRQLTLFVAIYLSLDFANPMMPGAVHLVGGSLETVAGCQARSVEAPVLTATMAPCPVVADVPRHGPVIRTYRWVVSCLSARAPPVPRIVRAAQHRRVVIRRRLTAGPSPPLSPGIARSVSSVRTEEGMGVRIKEGYEGVVVAGAMLAVAMLLIGAVKLIFG